MSGLAHITSIFKQYSVYELDKTPGGTPICTFSNPRGQGVAYAGGFGFAMTGGHSPLAFDAKGLEKYITFAESVADIPPAGIQLWREALKRLQAETYEAEQLRLSA